MNLGNALTQMWLAVFIGFGLALGAVLYFALFKVVDRLTGWLVHYHLGYRSLSREADVGHKVRMFRKLYRITYIHEPDLVDRNARTLILEGVGHKERIVITLLKDGDNSKVTINHEKTKGA